MISTDDLTTAAGKEAEQSEEQQQRTTRLRNHNENAVRLEGTGVPGKVTTA